MKELSTLESEFRENEAKTKVLKQALDELKENVTGGGADYVDHEESQRRMDALEVRSGSRLGGQAGWEGGVAMRSAWRGARSQAWQGVICDGRVCGGATYVRVAGSVDDAGEVSVER